MKNVWKIFANKFGLYLFLATLTVLLWWSDLSAILGIEHRFLAGFTSFGLLLMFIVTLEFS